MRDAFRLAREANRSILRRLASMSCVEHICAMLTRTCGDDIEGAGVGYLNTQVPGRVDRTGEFF